MAGITIIKFPKCVSHSALEILLISEQALADPLSMLRSASSV